MNEYTISIGSRSDKMSDREKKELFIAFMVLSLAFSITFSGGLRNISIASFPVWFGISALAVGTAFLFHEMAHRNLARKYGCWAEFRMWTWGLLMALFFSLFGFIFAAPGAVMINGYMTKEQSGKISAAGPATNWVVGTLFLIGAFALDIQGIWLSWILGFVALVNLIIGGFNLLPIGPLDGAKIFRWSMVNYALLAVAILGSIGAGYYLGLFF
ncbi:MAG: site-2 protease family protein [Thermoplasmata archaeon]